MCSNPSRVTNAVKVPRFYTVDLFDLFFPRLHECSNFLPVSPARFRDILPFAWWVCFAGYAACGAPIFHLCGEVAAMGGTTLLLKASTFIEVSQSDKRFRVYTNAKVCRQHDTYSFFTSGNRAWKAASLFNCRRPALRLTSNKSALPRS